VTERPRILVLTTSYPTEESPVAGIFVREHTLAAAAHCDLRVVLLDRGGERAFRPERLPDELVPAWRVGFPARPTAISAAGIVAAAAVGMRAATADGFVPDVLHAHFFLAGFAAVLLGRRRRLPVVVSEHWSVFLPDDPASLSRVLLAGARFTLERADLVLPVSAALERGIADHGIEARTRVVPNVFDEERFHPPERPPAGDPPRLLAVGLLYEAKGIDLLIEATALLRERGRTVHVDIVGDGALRADYERLARERGVADIVTFTGIRPKDEVAETMRRADVFVLPSRYDNNPCALIEALATGLPAVATDVGGVAEILGEDGILSRPHPEALAISIEEAIVRLDGFDREATARRAAERFGAERVGRDLAEIYAAVTNERKSQRHASR
jgi:glycosyltransferase involved in cell wall biosynthesis